MIGAQALIRSLHTAGLSVCFMNPGTSEIHLVSALDEVPGIRKVLCLFEGDATGAADGFGRMASVPAATLLHQGPGLANGLANLHNAKRASTALVNVVGDGATSHRGLGAPLEADITSLARPMSKWLRTATSAPTVGADAAAAWAAACGPPSGVATLVLPMDVAWSDGGRIAHPAPPLPPRTVGTDAVTRIARRLGSGPGTVVVLGGAALSVRGLAAIDRISQATGTKVFAEAFPSRLPRGVGVPHVERLSGDSVMARRQLADATHLVLVGAAPPVAAFASPGEPGELAPPNCHIDQFVEPGRDIVEALEHLADMTAGNVRPRTMQSASTSDWPPGAPLTAASVAQVLGALMPEGSVLVDEANSSGGPLPAATAASAEHDLLTLCGFAIGQGLPLSVGAQTACPDRPVICLTADGSAMYTLSALWTQAHERLDVTTIVLNNGSYSILRREARRALGDAAEQLSPLFDLSGPALDFVSLSEGMGVPATRAHSTSELAGQLKRALAEPGPHLIDAPIPALY
jgi:acetolactate synthase-1/2/3 large subunit